MIRQEEVKYMDCEHCGETNHFDVPLYEAPVHYEDVKPDADITVYGSVRLFEYRDHIEIKKDDWEKFKSVIIPLLKQGDMNHATRNTENWKQETNYASSTNAS